LSKSIHDRYEVHSGLIKNGEGEAATFAISDVVETTIAGMVIAACLVIYAGQLLVLKQIMDDYRAQGLVPHLRINSGFRKALTCQLDLEINAVNPRGEVVKSQKVQIGRRR
jgi:hypothetical protein